MQNAHRSRPTQCALTALVSVLLATFAAASDATTSTGDEIDEMVRTIRAEIVPGLPRESVDEILRRHGFPYVFRDRQLLERDGEQVHDGRQLDGRYSLVSPGEYGLFSMKQAFIDIAIDQQGHVVDVRVDGFGVK